MPKKYKRRCEKMCEHGMQKSVTKDDQRRFENVLRSCEESEKNMRKKV